MTTRHNVPAARVPDDIARAIAQAVRLAARPLDVHWTPSLASTMDDAAEAARAGTPEGYVVIAAAQTSGRGRRGRAWESPPDSGLYLSWLLRPPRGDTRTLTLLTLAMGVGVRRAVMQATGIAPDLKWPNDVVIGRRKLAGILAEGHGIATDEQAVIVGIGVNVRHAPWSDEVARRATSLEEQLGRPVAPAMLLEALLVGLVAVYDELRRGGADDILREWAEASPSASGATVEWDSAEGRHRGVTAGVDRDGALLVRTAASVERVVGGVLCWEG